MPGLPCAVDPFLNLEMANRVDPCIQHSRRLSTGNFLGAHTIGGRLIATPDRSDRGRDRQGFGAAPLPLT